jgi:hypothetical protein
LIVPANGTGGNYKVSGKQASYVWAMAEKRGKDRVIIKLAGIEAYSEEESDDFKERRDEPAPPPNAIPAAEPKEPGYFGIALSRIRTFASRELLNSWWLLEKPNREKYLTKKQSADLLAECRKHGETLGPERSAA